MPIELVTPIQLVTQMHLPQPPCNLSHPAMGVWAGGEGRGGGVDRGEMHMSYTSAIVHNLKSLQRGQGTAVQVEQSCIYSS